MKLSGIFLVLLVASSTTILFPIIKQDKTISMEPEQLQTIVININQPMLQLSTAIESEIVLNITQTLKSDIFVQIFDGTFTENIEISDLSPGFYIINMLSHDLGNLEISCSGLFMPSLIIFFVLIIINIYLLYSKLNELSY